MLIVIGLFLVSVLLRLPGFNRPLSKHHEFNAAMFLITMDIWNESSAVTYHYAPVVTYQNPGDKGVNNMTLEEMQRDGNYYYLSFPPATTLFPYAVFQLFGVDPSPLTLQWFNVFLHLASGLLLYFLIRAITSATTDETSGRMAALLATGFFFLSPTTLWFFGNGYTHHVLAIPFALLTLLGVAVSLNGSPAKGAMLTFLGLFLLTSTIWTGVLMAMVIAVLGIVQSFRKKTFHMLVWIPVLAVGGALFLFMVHYSAVIGEDTFINYLKNRFFVRSGAEGTGGFLRLFGSIGIWYAVGYSLWILLALFAVLRYKTLLKGSDTYRWVLLIAMSTAWLHHLLLSEFTRAHDYSALIDAIYIAILIAMLPVLFASRKKMLGITVFACFLVGIAQYFYINRPGEVGQNGDRYDSFERMGQLIRETAHPDEVVYVIGLSEKPAPQLMYYAKRNFRYADSVEEVRREMIRSRKGLAHIYFVDGLEIKWHNPDHILIH